MPWRLNLIVSGVRLVLKLYVEPSVTLATVISSSKAPTSVTLQTQAWLLQSNLRTTSHHEWALFADIILASASFDSHWLPFPVWVRVSGRPLLPFSHGFKSIHRSREVRRYQEVGVRCLRRAATLPTVLLPGRRGQLRVTFERPYSTCCAWVDCYLFLLLLLLLSAHLILRFHKLLQILINFLFLFVSLSKCS